MESFLSKYDPEIREQATRALRSLRKQIPGAVELVYDNYNTLVVAFGASEKMADIVCSIALYPRWVTLFFMHGATLPDPEKLLVGTGKTIRHIVLRDEGTIASRSVRALVDHAKRAVETRGPRKMIIKSVSAKQRPRTPVRKAAASPARRRR